MNGTFLSHKKSASAPSDYEQLPFHILFKSQVFI